MTFIDIQQNTHQHFNINSIIENDCMCTLAHTKSLRTKSMYFIVPNNNSILKY